MSTAWRIFGRPAVALLMTLGSSLAMAFQGSVVVQSTSTSSQSSVPVTFGHPFKAGDVPAGTELGVKLSSGTEVPAQVDWKAVHRDGSLRHGIITAVVPSLPGGGSEELTIFDRTSGSSASPAVARSDVLGTAFDATVNLDIAGKGYSASARDLLRQSGGTTWLSGSQATEWILSGAVKDGNGTAHPHLTAYFHVRAYTGVESIKVDVVVENNWTFVSNPDNFVYDASIAVSGATVYQKSNIDHHARARWKKTVWWGKKPATYVMFDPSYLIRSGAVASYDLSTPPSESHISRMDQASRNADTGPMGFGLIDTRFASGSEAAIDSPWAVEYILSMDKRAFDAMVAHSHASSSFGVHYREKGSGTMPSIIATRDLTLKQDVGGTSIPSGGDDGAHVDTAHQSEWSYIPYLVTGDLFYLEELLFWANYNFLAQNPAYREFEKGLIKGSNQIRGQAWGLRTLAKAAYVAPDAHPRKSYFEILLKSNIDWYTNTYVGGAYDSDLHILQIGYAFAYMNGTGIAPWQDNWVTSVFGYIVNMGYSEARPFLQWKAVFPVKLVTGPGYCWVTAPAYKLKVRDSETAPLYTTFSKVYAESYPGLQGMQCGSSDMASTLGVKIGEMIGYAHSEDGYYARLQGALAAAVDAGVPNAEAAWQQFRSSTVQPDWSEEGNKYNIVPFFSNTSSGVRPTVNLQASASSVSEGDSVTLSWSSTGAATCSASGDWYGARTLAGSELAGPLIADSAFALSCLSAAGAVAAASVEVSVGGSGGGTGGGGGSGVTGQSGARTSGSEGGGGLTIISAFGTGSGGGGALNSVELLVLAVLTALAASCRARPIRRSSRSRVT